MVCRLTAGESRIRTMGPAKGPSALLQIFQVSFIPAGRCEVRRRNAGRIRGFEEGESPRPTLTTRRVGGSPLRRSKASWSASWSTR